MDRWERERRHREGNPAELARHAAALEELLSDPQRKWASNNERAAVLQKAQRLRRAEVRARAEANAFYAPDAQVEQPEAGEVAPEPEAVVSTPPVAATPPAPSTPATPAASPVLPFVLRLAQGGFEGTATQLLQNVNGLADWKVKTHKDWPKDATRMGHALNQVEPELRAAGVTVGRDRKKRSGKVLRILRLYVRTSGADPP